MPTEYQDTVPGEFEEKVKQPKPVSQSNTQDSRPQTPLSEYSRKEFTLRPSPKLTRASSKVFEKVRGLEERRRSLDIPEGSISGRSWAGFNLAGSVDSDDGGSRLGISRESSREDLREALKEDAAERRSMFRQRAASLEEKPRYSQKVQDIENKFTEELQRIKKLVGTFDFFLKEPDIFEHSCSSFVLMIQPREFHDHLSHRGASTVSYFTLSIGKMSGTQFWNQEHPE